MPAPYTAFTFGDPATQAAVLQYPSPFFNAGLQPGVAPNTQQPSWGTWTMDPGAVGIAYDEEWYLENCATPVTYSLVSGALPPGLSLSSSSSTGIISGTPTTVGTYTFTMRATNSYGTADKSFSITISAAPASGGGSYTFFA